MVDHPHESSPDADPEQTFLHWANEIDAQVNQLLARIGNQTVDPQERTALKEVAALLQSNQRLVEISTLSASPVDIAHTLPELIKKVSNWLESLTLASERQAFRDSFPETLKNISSYYAQLLAEMKRLQATFPIETAPKEKKPSKLRQWLAFIAASSSISFGMHTTQQRGENIDHGTPAGPVIESITTPSNPLEQRINFPSTENNQDGSAPREQSFSEATIEQRSNIEKDIEIPPNSSSADDDPELTKKDVPVDYFSPPEFATVGSVLSVEESTPTYTEIDTSTYTPSEREVLSDGLWKKKIDAMIDAMPIPESLKAYYKSTDSFRVVHGEMMDEYLATKRRGSGGTTLLTMNGDSPGQYLIVVSEDILKNGQDNYIVRDTLIEERVQGILYDLFLRSYLSDPGAFEQMGIYSVADLTKQMTSGNVRAYLEWMQHALIRTQLVSWNGLSYTLMWEDPGMQNMTPLKSLTLVSAQIEAYLNANGHPCLNPLESIQFLLSPTGTDFIKHTDFIKKFGMNRMSRGTSLTIVPEAYQH